MLLHGLPFLFSTLLLPSLPGQTTAPPSPANKPAVQPHSCPVRLGASQGEHQLAGKEYKAAESTYQTDLSASPGSEEAQLGLIRALLGQDRVTEAQTAAAAMLQAKPGSPLAQVASAEVAFRAGDPHSAIEHGRAALSLDSCEGRTSAVLAEPLDAMGYHASAAQLLQQAHRLRPNDELIRRDWIETLPRRQREAELARYLEGPHALSADDQRDYSNALTHLKAHQAGTCRVTSRAESTRLHMNPVFGDRPHPVAFGLDVTFNNIKRRMQIDTGASGILLTESAARALKLTPEFQLKTGGVGDEGDRDSYLARVHEMRIGDVELSDCMVEVVSKSKLDVDGLIGMDVFSRWLVTLDYAGAEARLDPLPSRPGTPKPPDSADDGDGETLPLDRYVDPSMESWQKVLRLGHQILLPAAFDPHGPTHYLIMDTGASATVLSTAMARERGKLHGSDMEFVGLSGKVKKVYEINWTPLFVANLKLAPTGYYAYDITGISHSNGFETSGLLGLPTLQRLTIQIDYRDNLLRLSYDLGHDVQRF